MFRTKDYGGIALAILVSCKFFYTADTPLNIIWKLLCEQILYHILVLQTTY
jgi:hypothetical protein